MPSLFAQGWRYQRPVPIDNRSGSGAASGVQIPLVLDALNFDFSGPKSDGSDLRFSIDGATPLPYWLRRYDPTSRVAVAWVKTPAIAAGVLHSLLVHYGNPSAPSASSFGNTMSKASVDADTLALYPMDDGSGAAVADAAGSFPATLTGSPAWLVGDGGNFDQSNPVQAFPSGSALQFGNGQSFSSSVLNTVPSQGTIAFWCQITGAPPGAGGRLVNSVNSTSPVEALDLYLNNDGSGRLKADKWRGGAQVSLNSVSNYFLLATLWFHLAITWGPAGFELWINALREAKNTSETGAWGNGTFRAFYMAGAAGGNFVNAKFDELVVSGRQYRRNDILALVCRRALVSISTTFDKLAKSGANPVLPGGQSWDANATGEPNAYFEAGTFKMVYGASPSGQAWLGYATSSDGTGWTELAGNPVLGNGHGGEAGNAYRGSILRNPDGTAWRGTDGKIVTYYVTAPGAGAVLRAATGLDGDSITSRGTTPVLTAPSWCDGIANTHVVALPGGTFRCYFDAHLPTGSWAIGIAEGPTPYQFTDVLGGPIAGLQLDAGMVGGAWVQQSSDGRWHMFYQAAVTVDVPTAIFLASSGDGLHFVRRPGAVLQFSDAAFEFDQVADASIVVANGKVWLYYSGNNNSNPAAVTASIAVAIFVGTFDQLVTDAPTALSLDGTAELQPPTQAAVLAALAAVNPNTPAAGSVAQRLLSFQSGPGSDRCTLTIDNSTTGQPIAGASVWVTADAAGVNVLAGPLATDTGGRVMFLLNAGTTYYLWMRKDGKNPIEGQAFTAVAD